MLKHYYGSFVFTAIALIVGFLVGGLPGAGIILMLGILETSLSFDNAVVNASVLKDWDDKWRHRFIRWGIPIAVFGMRFLFPLMIVAIVAGLGPIDSLMLAINEPKRYETILTSVHLEIAAFGGAFLMMVFLKFFLDQEKDVHWVSFIERPFAKLGRLEAIEVAITIATIMIATSFVSAGEQVRFLTAGVWGVIAYILADGVGALLGGDEGADTAGQIVKAGIGGFIYLEILDASFSFDGVIASFALTNNVFIIMFGLAVGAFFVRSMTLHLVERGTLAEFKYLEHGAFWAIGVLAVIMFAGVVVEVPEVVTGLTGAGAIVMALYSSIKANKAEQA